jgi:hypothetical protein
VSQLPKLRFLPLSGKVPVRPRDSLVATELERQLQIQNEGVPVLSRERILPVRREMQFLALKNKAKRSTIEAMDCYQE